MGSKFVVPLRLLEVSNTPALPLTSWHKLYYKEGYLKTLKGSEKDVVLDRPLDGFVAGPCLPIVATDTVLEAFQKLQCQVSALAALDTFLELNDTPADYVGFGGYLVSVNVAENALEFVPTLDANTWDYPTAAFVDPVNGNDITAVVGDGNKPYLSLAAAAAASSFVVGLPGKYNGTHVLESCHYHFMPGAVLGSSDRFTDGGTFKNIRITGDLSIENDSYGFEFSGLDTVADIQIDRFENVRQFILMPGTSQEVTITARRATCNNNNGAAVGCRIANGAKLTLNFTEYCEVRHWLVATYSSGTADVSEFTINCPDLRVSNIDTYGNAFKALINDQGLLPVVWTVNLMGGKFVHENTNVTASFGIEDGALMLYVNVGPDEIGSKFFFKNGDFNGGVYRPIRASYAVINGEIQVENAQVRSTANESVLLFHQANNDPKNIVMRAKNTNFIGASGNGCMQIGAGNNVFLENCSLYASNIASAQIIKYDSSNTGGGAPNVYMYNCSLELENNGLGSLTDEIAGVMQFNCVNTNSSETIDPGTAENWGGYTRIPGFIVPKF